MAHLEQPDANPISRSFRDLRMSLSRCDKPGSEPGWNPTQHYRDAAVAEEYDRVRFSSLAGRVYLAIERHFLLKAFGNVERGATVLDAPCGTGRLAEILLGAGFDVVGADISPAMLSVASRRLASFGCRFRTVTCDAREMTAEQFGRRFDAALCARVLMHFPLEDQIKLLSGVSRVTKGPVIFTQSFNSPYQRFRRLIKRALRHQTPVTYPVTKDELDRLLSGAKLRLVHKYHLLSPISEAIVVVATRS